MGGRYDALNNQQNRAYPIVTVKAVHKHLFGCNITAPQAIPKNLNRGIMHVPSQAPAGLQRSGVALALCSSRACLHAAFIAFSVPFACTKVLQGGGGGAGGEGSSREVTRGEHTVVTRYMSAKRGHPIGT